MTKRNLFDELKRGIEEIDRHRKGKITLHAHDFEREDLHNPHRTSGSSLPTQNRDKTEESHEESPGRKPGVLQKNRNLLR